ncbi:DoxX family protein [Luteibacter rhizovicinus]|nr:DoxX family protein [Luteibacter rhizovicinus]KLD67108.1 hypothetical protein Y883_09080 [Luteibacter rhizovicinus DSM 16549]
MTGNRGRTCRLSTVDGLMLGLARLGRIFASPFLRVALALPFLRSGLTRWDPFPDLSLGTQFLFAYQFKLHLFGRVLDMPAPTLLAYATAVAEIILPVLLLVGLGTRVAALMLLVMTAFIQLVAPDGWANFHLYWASMALALVALGGGRLSLDNLIDHVRRQRPVSAQRT